MTALADVRPLAGSAKLCHRLIDEVLPDGVVLLGVRLSREPIGEMHHHLTNVGSLIHENSTAKLALLFARLLVSICDVD